MGLMWVGFGWCFSIFGWCVASGVLVCGGCYNIVLAWGVLCGLGLGFWRWFVGGGWLLAVVCWWVSVLGFS